MTERHFRLLIGIWLVVALVMVQPLAIYVLMGVLLFEGLTNLRVPLLAAKFSHQPQVASDEDTQPCVISFEAERALRLLIVGFLGLSLFLLPELLWWLPWFIGFALIGAGLSGICPMVQALRWIGMR
ncbi:MAG: hypothetical protein KKE76_14485 [Gammaproteobacteria bacterium]|nr:hypothetical protein [Gammaproteobacteria bacterium]